MNAKEENTTRHWIGGRTYEIPESESQKMIEYYKNVFESNEIFMKSPANLKALSFSVFLIDYFKEHFDRYETK